MKISRTETHDRLLVAKKQEDVIQQGVMDCKHRNPTSLALFEYSDYIYIFGHKREIGMDEKKSIFQQDLSECLTNLSYQRKYNSIADVPTFRILWQPRLSKPLPQENSWLFRSEKDSNDFEVYWVIPDAVLWGQNEKGKMMEDPIISESLDKFINDQQSLTIPHPQDLSLENIKKIYEIILRKDKFLKV